MQINKKKWVIVTGANGGIGRALCEEFTNSGHHVLALDLNDVPNNDLVHAVYMSLDLNQYALDQDYAESVNKQLVSTVSSGNLLALVNNAAVQLLENSRTMARSVWDETLRVNLSAPFFLSQAMLPLLEVTYGAIINISSIHASLTKKNFVAYATSKAALSALTRNMAIDLGARIRINAIEPAAIETDMLKAGFKGMDEKYRELESFHPMGRVGTPSEVAKLAVFLASEEAGFIQGACISATGGIHSCLSDPS
ncbi:SDR family oxidoreductase [Aliiglaciecola litoralis]|uniref:SDR family oxidoreductase n=1 Tax=Aliiglaciecola litoralis TaxID=582857 RepID=A0ABN1LJC7_9ALTE